MAGSNVVRLQAVDSWNNNITQGGESFAARWTPRKLPVTEVATNIYDSSTGDQTAAAVEEGDFWESGDGGDTASIAAGFFFPFSFASGGDTANTTVDGGGNSSGTVSPSEGDDTGAYVADVGGGRYEITTAPASGSYWLEIGVVEPGGLWGTYYEDGADEAEGRLGLTQTHKTHLTHEERAHIRSGVGLSLFFYRGFEGLRRRRECS